MGLKDAHLGAPLTIELQPGARSVVIEYETSLQASGLQWLELLARSQSATPSSSRNRRRSTRSWIPIQDSPGVRVTYSARIHAPLPLTALMSARIVRPGHFHLPQPIPPYLIALAVGDLSFQSVSARCGVWAESLCRPRPRGNSRTWRRWCRPLKASTAPIRGAATTSSAPLPSFLFGGMENPCLTFATPTVIAGDKSLVALVSHELAHSWSGNLVTNSTARFRRTKASPHISERRIQEALYGRRRSEMELAIEIGELRNEMSELPPGDQKLAVDLTGRDPDDGMTLVPYVRGAPMLRMLEEKHGRAKFDAWMKSYFAKFAFQSIDSEQFQAFLSEKFPGEDPERVAEPAGPAARRAESDARFRDETAPRVGDAGVAALAARHAGEHDGGGAFRARPAVGLHRQRQQRDCGAVADDVHPRGLLTGVAAPGAVPHRRGPAQVRQAAARGAGEDAGREDPRAGHLCEGAARLPPGSRKPASTQFLEVRRSEHAESEAGD
ncbi:MAG: hypothetical protein MZV70_29275 [Desulfobacterales bacterium]|nr:hypothetical protein [Desulfobacterales bacterium]